MESGLKEVLEGHRYSQNIEKGTGEAWKGVIEALRTLGEIIQLRE